MRLTLVRIWWRCYQKMVLQSGIEGFVKLFEQFMRNNALFIICIKFTWKWDENYRIATRYGPVRVVCFSSIEQKVDYYS